VQRYERAIRIARQPEFDWYLERARLQAANHQPDAAVDSLDEGLARWGRVASLENAALALEIEHGLHNRALSRLDGMIARTIRPEFLQMQRADVLLSAGRPGEARTSLSAALLAIDQLPDSVKHTVAVQQLLQRIRERVESIPHRIPEPSSTNSDS
jgi:predicted Zn-dependent protease